MPRLQKGKPYGAVYSDLSKAQTRRVLGALDGPPALDILARHPIKQITLKRFTGHEASGVYHRDTGLLEVNTIRRWGLNYGEVLAPGSSYSMSKSTEDPVESMRRSLLHESAHHIQEIRGSHIREIAEAAFGRSMRKPITKYANTDWAEYLAECWTAYHVDSRLLRWFDPNGYKMIEDVLDAIRKRAK